MATWAPVIIIMVDFDVDVDVDKRGLLFELVRVDADELVVHHEHKCQWRQW